MAYQITYTMLTGASAREAFTAIEAVVEYRALQQAGAGQLVIRDPNGISITMAELLERASSEATIPTVKRPLKRP